MEPGRFWFTSFFNLLFGEVSPAKTIQLDLEKDNYSVSNTPTQALTLH